jgi:hypothetical protein
LHITELRMALNELYMQLALEAPAYTDLMLTAGAVIKAVHLAELRLFLRQTEIF